MFDAKKLRKAVMAGPDKSTKESPSWRMVPIVCLIESFEERAAILQFDAGFTRADAERESEAQNAKRFRVYELVCEG